jgi:hypothetical protein
VSRRLRSGLAAVLIALSCLLLPFGTLAAWAAYGLTDTGRYVTTMAPLATDPAVQAAVADTFGDDIVRRTPALHGMDPYVRDAVRSFTATRAYRAAWNAGNEAAHTAVMTALHDDRDRTVTVDLAPVAASVRHQFAAENMPFAHRVPVTHTRVALLPAAELAALRKGYHVLDIAGFWLPLAAVALAVTGISVAVCRRRALTATALGTALGGALLVLAVAVGRRLTLTDLPDPAHRPAAGAIYDALTSSLRTASWLLVALGLTLAATIHLAHATRRRVLTRRALTPYPDANVVPVPYPEGSVAPLPPTPHPPTHPTRTPNW